MEDSKRRRTMNLENLVVGLCMIGYLIVGVSFLFKNNYPWALIWFSYGTANLGLIWAQNAK